MRLFILWLLVINCFHSYGQKITSSETENTVTVIRQDGKYCKQLFVQRNSKRCNKPIVFYTPIYKCSGKELSEKKRPHLTFKEELPIIMEMFDTVKQYMLIDLCMYTLNIGDYDDLLSRHIDVFASSEEWAKSIKRLGTDAERNPKYDHGLMLKILRKEDVFEPVNKMLNTYGSKIAIMHASEKDMKLVPKSTLKRLKKDENLLIPLPDPVSLQLSAIPKIK